MEKAIKGNFVWSDNGMRFIPDANGKYQVTDLNGNPVILVEEEPATDHSPMYLAWLKCKSEAYSSIQGMTYEQQYFYDGWNAAQKYFTEQSK